MATLKCFTIAGLKLWFWSNDHKPPHFHAKKNGYWEVRVNFLEASATMFALKWEKKPFSAKDRKALEEMVKVHRADLFKEWEDKVQPS